MPDRELENRLLQGTGPRLAGLTRDSLEGAGPFGEPGRYLGREWFQCDLAAALSRRLDRSVRSPFTSLPQGDPPDHFLMLNLTHERTHLGSCRQPFPTGGAVRWTSTSWCSTTSSRSATPTRRRASVRSILNPGCGPMYQGQRTLPISQP